MRTTFAKELINCAREDKSVFLLTGDLGFSVLEPFAQEFPERFLNIGIAEQNMTGVAAGLAKEGYTVFTYSIGNFPTLRCMEQIRYDVCYHNLNVKVIAVGAGYAYGPLGVSHHTTEDIGMLRTIPNMTVCSPCDPQEASSLTKMLVQKKGPGYMRLNRTGEASLHLSAPDLTSGEPIRLLSGKKKLILGTGAILQDAFKVAQKEGWEVWSFPIVSPMGSKWVNDLNSSFEEVLTVEEHQLNAGFGSAILEILSDAYQEGRIFKFPKIRRIGIRNQFLGFSGSQGFLRSKANLLDWGIEVK